MCFLHLCPPHSPPPPLLVTQMTSFGTTTGEMGKYTTEADARPRKPTEPLPSFGRHAGFTATHQVYVTGDC